MTKALCTGLSAIARQLSFYLYFLPLFFVALNCTGEVEPEKIQLFDPLVATRLEAGSEKPDAALNIPVFSMQLNSAKPVVLIIHDTENSENNTLVDYLHDATNVITYLLEQNTDLTILSHSQIEKWQESNSGNTLSDIINSIVSSEKIEYVIRGNSITNSSNLGINFTLFDARSNASVARVFLSDNSLNGTVSELLSAFMSLQSRLSAVPNEPFMNPDVSFRAVKFFTHGLEAESNNDYNSAERLYLSALDEDLTFAQPRFQLISLYFSRSPLDNSFLITDHLKKVGQHRDQLAEKEKFLLAGYQNFSFQKYQEALSSFKSFSVKYPYEIEGYLGQARTYLVLEQPDLAYDVLREVGEIERDNMHLLKIQSEIYWALGEFEEAVRYNEAQQAIETGSSYPSLEKAKILISWGRLKDAETVLNDILSSDSDNITALVLLGELYFNLMDFEKNIAVSDQILKVANDDRLISKANVYYFQILSNMYLGKYSRAMELTNQLIDLDEEDFFWKNNLLFSTYRALMSESLGGDFLTDPITEYLEKEEILDFNMYQLMIVISKISNDNEFSGKLDDKINSLFDSNTIIFSVLNNFGEGLSKLNAGDFQSAISHLKETQQYEFNSVVAYFLCKAYLESGKLDEAEEQMELFYSNMDISDFESAYSFSKFNLIQADLLERKGRFEEANALYNSYLQMWSEADDRFTALEITKRRLAESGG